MKIGYARVSTDAQDLEGQRAALRALDVEERRIYVDQLSGSTRARPGLERALDALREGDELVVPKLDRLGRSLRDLLDIAQELEDNKITLSIGGSQHDPSTATGRLLFNALAMIAEFARDIISERTKAGMQVARANGRLKGRGHKLRRHQRDHLIELHRSDRHSPRACEPVRHLEGLGLSLPRPGWGRVRPLVLIISLSWR
jgi:DNA invertase Pin-like site-specific DNA recombinase